MINIDYLVSSFIFLSILYMIKTVSGIDLVNGCHADEVIFFMCNKNQLNIEKTK